MTSITISVPESLKQFIEQKVTDEGFGTVSEYIRSLVRADQKKYTLQQLEEMLQHGLQSGKVVADAEFWQNLSDRLASKYHSRSFESE